ncbi:MAG: hypothetical protein AB1374_11715 [Bacillota bacterium]
MSNRNEAAEAKIQRFVVTDLAAAQIQFVDLINASWDTERIVLTFIQKSPLNLPPGAEQDKIDGRVVTQVAITWPHLVRLRDLFTRMIESEGQKVLWLTNEALGKDEESEVEEKSEK